MQRGRHAASVQVGAIVLSRKCLRAGIRDGFGSRAGGKGEV